MPIPRLGQVELGVFHLHAGLKDVDFADFLGAAKLLRRFEELFLDAQQLFVDLDRLLGQQGFVVTHAHVVDHAPPLRLPGVPRLLDLVAGHGKAQAPLAAGDDLLRHSAALQPLGPIVADFIRDVFEGRVGVQPGLEMRPFRGADCPSSLDRVGLDSM